MKLVLSALLFTILTLFQLTPPTNVHVVAGLAVAATPCGDAATGGTIRYVLASASGTASGLSWTNALTNLPASPTRGLTYCIGDGAYGSKTFNTANSGTTLINIVKATTSDHGTETGWSSTFGDGQATWTHWTVTTDYWIFNGQVRNSDWWTGTLDQYGFKVAGAQTLKLDSGLVPPGGDHLTLKYVHLRGGGRDSGDGNDDIIQAYADNVFNTFQYCALTDSNRTIIKTLDDNQDYLFEYNYIARNASHPDNPYGVHGEMWSSNESTRWTWRYNWFEDLEGTGIHVAINGGVAADWSIYGNIYYQTAAYRANTGRLDLNHNQGIGGVINIPDDASNRNSGQNILFYNNTLVDWTQGSFIGVEIQKDLGGTAVRNNIFYNDSIGLGFMDAATISHNWYFNTSSTDDAGTGKVTCSSSCSAIFASYAGANFHVGTAVSAGVTLSSPFNVDPDGTIRGVDGTWDRGAYEKP